jgi:hypothetical protein
LEGWKTGRLEPFDGDQGRGWKIGGGSFHKTLSLRRGLQLDVQPNDTIPDSELDSKREMFRMFETYLRKSAETTDPKPPEG